MDPLTLAITGAAVTGAGSLASGISQSSADRQQASILDRNAALSDQQAGQVYAQGVEREMTQRHNADQQLGTQRAAIAESGFDPSSGSALETQVQSTRNAELDALQTRYQGILQGATLEDQATQQRYQANVARSNARSALTTGVLSAAGSALSGFASYSKLAGGVAGSGGSFSTLFGPSSTGTLGSTGSWGVGSNSYGFRI